MKYLVIVTIDESTGVKYMHFVDLKKDFITNEIKSLVAHLYWKKQTIVNCYFSNGRLTNW